ncbi:hypothetical protein [Sphingobacterium griseoflavum]|uniref:Uncharacterized protein n=1 Tax=Sphingobacterium griseoflavum TaxID=1474952 RepID=A0ABQ3HU98_9SPHI|nr:hypothetical protein [Sphingobacterium griseoflavum]GHE35057.1 hypothetical protein GCM10017764_17840 [Sphingobacterium griseoflavum]
MDKLTLEHLAPYLPYGLKIIDNGEVNTITGIIGNKVFIEGCHRNGYSSIDEVKPILRPLSDLTKEIDHNGERFVPIHRILEAYCFNVSKMSEDEIMSYVESLIEIDISYMTVKILCELHFDFQGLIAAGLAVDMNTLEGGSHE